METCTCGCGLPYLCRKEQIKANRFFINAHARLLDKLTRTVSVVNGFTLFTPVYYTPPVPLAPQPVLQNAPVPIDSTPAKKRKIEKTEVVRYSNRIRGSVTETLPMGQAKCVTCGNTTYVNREGNPIKHHCWS